MAETVEIGRGRSASRGYHLNEISLVPSRRTRDVDDVSTSWQIDAYPFDVPLVAQPSDATMSPATVIEVGRLGGLGVLNAEGLWTRYDDPAEAYDEISSLRFEDEDEYEDDEPGAGAAGSISVLQRLYAQPVRPELIARRIAEIRAGGVTVAIRLSPQHTLAYAPTVLAAGVDLLLVHGTIVSAEHVSSSEEPLNLKTFIAGLDIPVIVGGCTSYATALHLMRTGAAGVIVGSGSADWQAGDDVLGIGVPMATAIADAAAARREYLDETGGRYVHVIAHGGIDCSGDISRAIACGADAVMLGEALGLADEAPARGAWWDTPASHPTLPRGSFTPADFYGRDRDRPGGQLGLSELLFGPATDAKGKSSLFGGLKRSMAKCGYRDLKEFQKVDLVVG